MRSSKSRSRSKSNRPRTLGNVTNRVFDSSGPEGKVRGTPQQIIDKYLILARDAQLSNDRVAAENFLQHAEHYTRLLGEAQREQAAEQESRRQQDQQNQQRDGQNQQRDRYDRGDRGDGAQNDRGNEAQAEGNSDPVSGNGGSGNGGSGNGRRDDRRDDRRDRRQDRSSGQDSGDVMEPSSASEEESTLVDTPETRRPPRQRGPKPQTSEAPAPAAIPAAAEDASSDAASDKPARRPRVPRGPRKPKAAEAAPAQDGSDPREAAE
jgi:hypothetical protein